MSPYHPEIVSGLSVRVAGIVLAAVLDEQNRTARIVQCGEPVNGEGAAIEAAREMLAGRVRRTRPDLRLES